MYHIIVNPASRTGKGKSIWSDLEPVLVDRGVDYKVIFSKKAGHVIELVKDLTGYTLASSPNAKLKLIVLGGDGTMNEALQGVSDFDRVEIGYIPTGSSNDFARDLQLPLDPVKCLNNILDCKEPVTMDLGMLTYDSTSKQLSRQHENNLIRHRYFDVSCGIGYDAAICEEALVSPIKKVLNKVGLGKLVYLCIALKQLFTTKLHKCVMTIDDEIKVELPNFLFAACMIHQYEGGGFMFSPKANYHDGIIDICTVSNISKFTVLRALPKAMKGKHFKYKGVDKYSGKKIHIETEEPLWVHTDGEVTMKSSSITVSCEQEKLQLLM